MEQYSDEKLMQLVSKGNRKAFEVLYDRYFEKLVHFTAKITGDLHKSEDIVQESFIKLIENPTVFDTNRKFSTWIYSVTGNAGKNHLRNEQTRMRILQQSGDTLATSYLHHRVDYEIMKTRLQTVYSDLNEKEKAIFTLRFEHDLSIAEVAEIMSIPTGSVKSGIYYMLKKIAYELKEFTDDK